MSSSRKPASHPIETEAKIHVSSFAPIRRRIKAAGGRLTTVRTLETNTLFDSRDGSLRASGRSFRVRRYGAVGVVTLKGPATIKAGTKTRMELETEVASPEMLRRILEQLGFDPTFRYDKFREVWKIERAVLCLDETPAGNFVEIEGTVTAIHRVAKQLDLAADRFISTSYPGLWAETGGQGDMVFPKPRSSRPVKKRG